MLGSWGCPTESYLEVRQIRVGSHKKGLGGSAQGGEPGDTLLEATPTQLTLLSTSPWAGWQPRPANVGERCPGRGQGLEALRCRGTCRRSLPPPGPALCAPPQPLLPLPLPPPRPAPSQNTKLLLSRASVTIIRMGAHSGTSPDQPGGLASLPRPKGLAPRTPTWALTTPQVNSYIPQLFAGEIAG